MADPSDVYATKLARREFHRHHVDVSLADIRVLHGVVYIRGTIGAERTAHYLDVKEEVERIARLLKQRPEVRDVVLDAMYRYTKW
jgi:hypothetical protein